jgi:hypothetical protein
MFINIENGNNRSLTLAARKQGYHVPRMFRALAPPMLLVLIGLPSAPPMAAQIDVLTERYDNARSGANLKETKLTPSNVNKDHFGKLAFRIVDGNIYAQPLIVSQAKIHGHPPANVVIVATEHNSVYAFDAEDLSAEPAGHESIRALWHTGPAVLGTHVESQDLDNRLGAADCTDLTTEVGITGTPAIKLITQASPKEGIIFVVAKSMQGDKFVQKLFALSLEDGTKASETVIAASVPGLTSKITFDPLIQVNRPALLIENNILYIAFGSHCDEKNYHGWVFAYDVSVPKTPKKLAAFSDTLTERTGNNAEGRAGIWMSGQGPAADSAGNVFLVTGDGTSNGTTDFGNSVLKLKLVSGKLQIQDWFTPANSEQLKALDADLGSGGALPVPNSHLLLTGGKEGRMYLLDRNDLGRGTKAALHDFQVTNNPFSRVATPNGQEDILFWNLHGSPVIWPQPSQMYVYAMGEEDHLKQYKLVPDARTGWKFDSDTPFKESLESTPLPNPPNGLPNDKNRGLVWMPGGFLALSADGDKSGTGVVWASMPLAEDANPAVVRGVLRAFDASDVSNGSKGQLWSSEDEGIPGDSLGMFAKFCPPTVANGKVYVATFQEERVENGVHKKMPGGNMPALVIYGPR